MQQMFKGSAICNEVGIDAADGKGDPSELSYNVVTIDFSSQNMTVREYLGQQKKWGTSKTISLATRSK